MQGAQLEINAGTFSANRLSFGVAAHRFGAWPVAGTDSGGAVAPLHSLRVARGPAERRSGI